MNLKLKRHQHQIYKSKPPSSMTYHDYCRFSISSHFSLSESLESLDLLILLHKIVIYHISQEASTGNYLFRPRLRSLAPKSVKLLDTIQTHSLKQKLDFLASLRLRLCAETAELKIILTFVLLFSVPQFLRLHIIYNSIFLLNVNHFPVPLHKHLFSIRTFTQQIL